MTSADHGAGKVDVLRIDNDQDLPLTVVVEPWGRHYDVQPGHFLRLAFSGPGGEVTLQPQGNRLVVFGWTGANLRVDVGSGWDEPFDNPVPPVPGVPRRSRLRRFFDPR